MCCVTSVLTLSAQGPTSDVNSDSVAPNWDTILIHVPCQADPLCFETGWSIAIGQESPARTIAFIHYVTQYMWFKHLILFLYLISSIGLVAVNFHQRWVFSLMSQSILNQFPWNFASTLFNYSGAYHDNFVKFEWVFQKLDHLTCSRISWLKLIAFNGFIEERYNSQKLHVK